MRRKPHKLAKLGTTDPTGWTAVISTLGLPPQLARIVMLILEGNGDKQIAAAMKISFSTVRTYLDRIFLRLGVHGRTELIVRLYAERDALLQVST